MRCLGSPAELTLGPTFPGLGEMELELFLREAENTSPLYDSINPRKQTGALFN